MGLFSSKEDTRYIAEFDAALKKINSLSADFRQLHFLSLSMIDKNFQKEKSRRDLEKERKLFEQHLDTLQKMKHQTDILLDEAIKIVRNESAITERDRDELHKLLSVPKPTGIMVKKK